MSAPHESTGPHPTQITTAIPMRNKVLKLILMLALMLGIGACQTGPQTGKAGSGAISTLQQEDVLRAIPDGKHLYIEIKSGNTNLGADERVIVEKRNKG